MRIEPLKFARLQVWAAAAVCCTAATPGAWAGPYALGASQNLSHTSNLLLLPQDQAEPTGYTRADTLHATTLTAGLDQPLGRQRLFGDFTLRNERYDANSRYNNVGYALNLGADLATVERVTGRLQVGVTRSLASFGLGTGSALVTQRNIQDGSNLEGLLRWGLDTRWTLEAGLGERRVRNALDVQATRRLDLDEGHGSLALRWAAGPDLNLALAAQRSRGSYPHAVATSGGYEADRYASHTLALDAAYRASAKSRIEARLAHSQTQFDLNQARSFSGLTGSLRWAWSPTAKLNLALRWARETGQDSALLNPSGQRSAFNPTGAALSSEDTRSSSAQQLRLDYAASAKLSWVAQWQRTQRHLARQLAVQDAASLRLTEGDETQEGLLLGLRWSPWWRWQMGCDLAQDQRRADVAIGYSYRASKSSCFVQYTGL